MDKQADGNHLYEKHADVKAALHVVGVPVSGKVFIGKTQFYEVVKPVWKCIADNYDGSKGYNK